MRLLVKLFISYQIYLTKFVTNSQLALIINIIKENIALCCFQKYCDCLCDCLNLHLTTKRRNNFIIKIFTVMWHIFKQKKNNAANCLESIFG